MPAADDLGATVLRMTGVQPLQHARCAGSGGVAGADNDGIDALSAGAVCDERLAPTIEMMAPRVPPAAGEHFQAARLRPELPDTAAAQAPRAVRRLDVRVNIDGLIEIQHSVVAPTQRVDH